MGSEVESSQEDVIGGVGAASMVKVESAANASSGNSPICQKQCSGWGMSYSLCASGTCQCSSCMDCPNHDSGRECQPHFSPAVHGEFEGDAMRSSGSNLRGSAVP